MGILPVSLDGGGGAKFQEGAADERGSTQTVEARPRGTVHYRQDRAKIVDFALENKEVKRGILASRSPSIKKSEPSKRFKKTKNLRELRLKRFSGWIMAGLKLPHPRSGGGS
jgi:hypothetical protein